jgi:hypothetical protein
MIVFQHDYGWGPEWPVKQIEQEITHRYLAPLIGSNQRVVLINSTWYGQEQHEITMAWLRYHAWDLAILICMIDAPIPAPAWFAEFDRPVLVIGSCPGPHHVSLWAEVVARHIQPFPEHEIDRPFMCLNRKPHWHRVRVCKQLASANLLTQGLVSLGGSDRSPAVLALAETVAANDLAPNGGKDYHGIPNDILSLGDLGNWRRHFINVVTETVFDVDAKYFVSEKIFKPILGQRPFLVYAENGAEQWLTQQGFETYLDDFRDITDVDLRDPDNIVPFLSTVCAQGSAYWNKKYLDLVPKIQYNLHRFNEFVREQRRKIQQGITCPI